MPPECWMTAGPLSRISLGAKNGRLVGGNPHHPAPADADQAPVVPARVTDRLLS